jgi:ribosomal-protein-alanine N-acetyltransferase
MLKRHFPKKNLQIREVKIREMNPPDLSDVLSIERVSFRPPWSKRIFLEEMASESKNYFVLELGERVIGYAGLSLILDEAHITTLAIHPRYRRRGFGEILLRYLISKAKEGGASIITLEVRESNFAARGLYGKLGFKEVGKRLKYYLYPAEDAVIMTLVLKEEENTFKSS